MTDQANEETLRTITIELRKPIQINTRMYGPIELRRLLSIGDLAFIGKQLKRKQSTREFCVRLIRNQLAKPRLSLRQIRGWKDRLLVRVAWKLVTEDNIKASNTENAKPSFDAVKNEVEDYIAGQQRSLKVAMENMQKSFSWIDKSILDPNLSNLVRADSIIKMPDTLNANYQVMSAAEASLANSIKLTEDYLNLGFDKFRGVESLINEMSKERVNPIAEYARSANLALVDAAKSLHTDLIAVETSQALGRIMEASFLAQASLADIVPVGVGSIVNLDNELRLSLAQTLNDVSASYAHLLKFDRPVLPELFSFPGSISRLPSIEYFRSADLTEVISVREEERLLRQQKQAFRKVISSDAERSLNSLLSALDPNFISVWKGAREARQSGNPDKIRHFTISMRELFTQVLHRLAPDDEVRAWTKRPEHYSNNIPTREARLLYICRGINSPPLDRFVENDVRTVIEFLKIFQIGTHEIAPQFTDEQLIALEAKLENTLIFFAGVGKIKLTRPPFLSFERKTLIRSSERFSFYRTFSLVLYQSAIYEGIAGVFNL
jgi:hypothetical protein